jgi:hypothetical protein
MKKIVQDSMTNGNLFCRIVSTVIRAGDYPKITMEHVGETYYTIP